MTDIPFLYLTQIEGITSGTRCKLIREFKHVNDFVKDALQRICFDAKVHPFCL